MALGLPSITADPTNDRENGEELMHVQPGVYIALANLPRESHDTLYITIKELIWVSDVDRSKGYAVDFLSISIHGVFPLRNCLVLASLHPYVRITSCTYL